MRAARFHRRPYAWVECSAENCQSEATMRIQADSPDEAIIDEFERRGWARSESGEWLCLRHKLKGSV